ncbi:MAG: hypothetical protein HY820_17475 [Acidobacteria bacterium]|nr:hypothetical protein [Acidobacteriota bacterium]
MTSLSPFSPFVRDEPSCAVKLCGLDWASNNEALSEKGHSGTDLLMCAHMHAVRPRPVGGVKGVVTPMWAFELAAA